MGSEQLALGDSLGDTVRKREFEILAEKLLDIGTLDIIGLLDLDDPEDLRGLTNQQFKFQ